MSQREKARKFLHANGHGKDAAAATVKAASKGSMSAPVRGAAAPNKAFSGAMLAPTGLMGSAAPAMPPSAPAMMPPSSPAMMPPADPAAADPAAAPAPGSFKVGGRVRGR